MSDCFSVRTNPNQYYTIVTTPSSASVNRLLKSLPSIEYERLQPHLKDFYLSSGKILWEPGDIIKEVYFPTGGMISVVSIMEDGSTTEVGLIGNEGMVGLPAILGGGSSVSRALVQVEGTGLKIRSDILKEEFDRGGVLQKRLLLYTQARLTQVSQTAACNSQHVIEKRLARWLLLVSDCTEKDELPLTQEFIAQMLGIRRSGVTDAAGKLQKLDLINYHRGHIKILDRQGLVNEACECYQIINKELSRLLDK